MQLLSAFRIRPIFFSTLPARVWTRLVSWLLTVGLLLHVASARGQVSYAVEPGAGADIPSILIPRAQWGLPDYYAISLPHQACGNLKSLRVEVRLDTGPDHVTGSAFTTAQPVTVTVSSTGSQVAPATFRADLAVSAAQPEQWRLLDVGSFLGANSAANDLTVRVSVPTAPTTTGASPSTQRIILRCVPEYETYSAAALTVTPTPVAPAPGYEQQLAWTSNCSLIGSFQVQLLHRPVKVARTGTSPASKANYDPMDVPTPAEWEQKGLLLETGSPNPYYNLTLAEGEGTYHWRVRALGSQPGGVADPANWGAWAAGAPFQVQAPDAETNWIYSRTFSEGGHVAEKLTFATGLQQVRQTQTRLATPTQTSTELGAQVVAVQTVQDFAGRDAVTSLPIPLPGPEAGKLGFKKNLLTRSGVPYEAADFDQTSATLAENTAREPRAAAEQGYYSRSNDRVADAEGYPFSRTVFSNDGTNRVVEQGGVGAQLRVKATDAHTVRTAYASVAPREIIRLFGQEAPQVEGLYKIITTDPNNVSSVTYQTKEGKTIATAVAGGSTTSPLENLPSAAGSTTTIQETITGQGQLISKVLTLTEAQTIELAYTITPTQLRQACVNYCSSCDYQVLLRVVEVSDETQQNLLTGGKPWIIRAADHCTNGPISYPAPLAVQLPAGTYRIEREVVPADFYPVAAADALVTNEAEKSRTLADHLTEIRKGLTAQLGTLDKPWTQMWAGIKPYLDPAVNDVQGLASYLAGKNLPIEEHNGQPCYKIAAGCDDFLYFPVLTDPCPPLFNPAAPGFAAQLEETIGQLNAQYPAPATQYSATALLQQSGYTAAQFDQLITNMVPVQQPDPNHPGQTIPRYPSEQLQSCWAGVLAGLELTLYQKTGLPPDYQVNVVKEFLQCTGVDIVQLVPKTASSLDVTRAFAQVTYTPTQNGDGPDEVCIRSIDPTNTLTHIVANFSTYSADLRDQVYNCLTNRSTAPTPSVPAFMTRAEAEDRAAPLLQQAKDACETRRDEFRRAIVQRLHQQGQYVEGDVYAWTPGADGITPSITQDLLPAATPRITSCEVEALAQGMVEQCQRDVQLTPVLKQGTADQYVGIGTPEELEKLQQVLFSEVRLYVKNVGNNSVPTGFTAVPATALPASVPPVRIISFENWASPREWTKYESQRSAAIPLEGGKRYYIEALQRENYIVDNLAVGWQLGDQAIEGPIPGKYLSPVATAANPNPAAGSILLERWYDLGENYDVSSIPVHTPPKDVLYPSAFEDPANNTPPNNNLAEMFGTRMRGYIIPPTTGSYTFYLASDDHGELWLSPAPVCPPTTTQQLYYSWAPVDTSAAGIIKDPTKIDRTQPVYYPQPEPCNVTVARSLRTRYEQEQERWMQTQLTAFTDHFQQQCVALAGQQETFTVQYTQGYHHFTLYYYDRAGNLIRTVPPAGVQPLDNLTDAQVATLLQTPDRRAWPATAHRLATTYTYNSLHQLVQQSSPDGGETHFFYNRKGQLRFSQNARQRAVQAYSYTRYDALGRVTEVGESTTAPAPPTTSQELPYVLAKLEDMGFPDADAGRQVTRTIYGESNFNFVYQGQGQRYLTGRVACSYYDADGNPETTRDNCYSYYSYDAHGNVEWLAQVQDKLGSKGVRYAYDLLSNKVTQVSYQQGEADQFFHRYGYDGDNRLTQVQTSSDGVIWEQDARYRYFAHGPLRRLELGEDHVQGLDYTYTLQGWLKGINHPGQDPGQDGSAAKLTGTAKDAFGMSLGYFTGDYVSDNAAWVSGASSVLQPQRSLYNGNIAAWTTKTRYDLPNAPALSAEALKYLKNPVGEHYRYDQLNRLLSSELSYKEAAAGAFTSTPDYATTYSYDPNGNLQSLTRNGASALGQLAMDQLAYRYDVATGRDNRLQRVNDATPNQPYYDDVKQNASTSVQYGYDEIGNLTQDNSAAVTSTIAWNVYGKMAQVTQSNGNATFFAYDAQGNRVRKTRSTSNGGLLEHTYYVRDAQGNVLAVYEQQEQAGQAATAIRLTEQPLYGSSRLGLRKLAAGSAPAAGAAGYYARVTQQKQYELVDHLGNVRALVGDTKRVDGEVAGSYKPDLLAYYNYYPFGMLQPGRSAPSNSTLDGGYRYGYNGMEKDDYQQGIYTSEFRQLSVNLARWLSVDPEATQFPHISPYSSMSNSPLFRVDPNGNEDHNYAIHENGEIEVQRTSDPTNSYTYIKNNGSTVDLGTYDVEANGMVQLPEKGLAYKLMLPKNGATYLPEDGLAAMLGATYSYYTKTGYISKINQLMTVDKLHSPRNPNQKHPGKPSLKTLVDAQYISSEGTPWSRQPDTRHGDVSASNSLEYANEFRRFGFNGEGAGWNVITLNASGTSSVFENSAHTLPHYNHIHFQQIIKIREVKDLQIHSISPSAIPVISSPFPSFFYNRSCILP